jgi:hypothetical protein
MKVRHCACLVACVIMALCSWPAAAIQLLDVLFLSDGSSVTGVIVEEEPGKNLVLENEEGQLREYRFKDIERIEKLFVDEESLIQNRDVVYLRDGVVFRGTIVGRVPEKAIRLELENGQLLDFDMKEIFKIGKEQVATGVVRKAVIEPKKAEKKEVEIRIQIAMNQLRLKQERLDRGGDAAEGESLKDEVDRLKNEIQQLEEQQEVVDAEAAEEAARFAAIESELGEYREQLLGAAGELEQRIAACESPQVSRGLQAKYDDLERSINEVLQRAEVVALVEQPDPRVEEIEMEAKATDALALARTGLWAKPEYEEQWKALVAELPFEQRRQVFWNSRKSDSLGKALLNAIPLIGLGSWRQKDYLGGAIIVTTGITGLALYVTYELLFAATPQDQFLYENLDYIGGGIALAGYAFGIIEPFLFNTKQNMNLRDALELERRAEEVAIRQRTDHTQRFVFPAPPAEPEFRLYLVRYEY